MNVCLLSAAPAGDDASDPLVQLPRRFAARPGNDVVLALPERPRENARGAVRVAGVGDLAGTRFDVALALGWRAAARLYEIDAQRYALFVPGLDHRTLNAAEADRILATLAIDLPLDLVAGAEWIAAELRELRPEARVLPVAPGIDRELFAASSTAPTDGALRILLDGRSGSAAAGEAAARAMRTPPAQITMLSAAEDGAARAARYREADVLVQLDAQLGALGAPLEAMAAGLPCVVAAGPDAADLPGDGVALVPAGDAAGAARALDRLAADPVHRAELAAGALAGGGAWPTWDDAAARLEAALATILAEPPPPAALVPRRLLADADAAVSLFGTEFKRVIGAYERLESDELVRAGTALRSAYRSARLAGVRRAASPLVVRAKKRMGSGD